MCGICGYIGLEDKKLIKAMSSIISHRGPDDHGFFTDKNISLGHRRLSIIDLSKNGKQPMCNEDETVWISFNGEIYNYLSLKADLEKKGHKFSTNTDTEAIIHAYEEYGTDCLNMLNGMFAFAIWDGNKRKLLLARDRHGKKPLFYTLQGDVFLFASEIKALLLFHDLKREINPLALHEKAGVP
jgi:asparagine synthase (glutamine-hydrolysing)